jgi:hypothetical protein
MLVKGGGFGLIGDLVVRVWGNNRPIGEFRMLSTSARCRSTRLFNVRLQLKRKGHLDLTVRNCSRSRQRERPNVHAQM